MFALHASRPDLLRTGLVTSSLILAGCADDSTVGSERESGAEDRIANPETVSIRGDADTPLVRVATKGDDADETDDRDDGDKEPDDLLVLTDSADADALEYDRHREGSNDVRELLAETTFEEESVIAYQARVSECYERCLEYVDVGTDRFALQFCRVERDAPVACEIDREQLQATFVRVPVAYEDDPSRWSVGGSSSCRTNSTNDNGDESEGKDEDGTANAEDDE